MNTRSEPVRVLVINSGSRLFGGVSSFLYNVYTHLDRDRVQFDFLSPNITTYEVHRGDIEGMGGRIYALGISGGKLSRKLNLYRRLKAFLKAHPYRIVHINSGDFYFNLFAGRAARDAGIKNVIIHSHSVGNPQDLALKRKSIELLKGALEGLAGDYCACSEEAARFMFTPATVEAGRVDVVRNGIDVKKFDYDVQARTALRAELGLSDKVVLGHVGRIAYPKNQAYLIEVLARARKRWPNAVLMLLGEGEHEAMLREKAREKGLGDAVLFQGVRTDVERYYQAMDVFLFPSLYEGFGMVLIEAQIAGLPCVSSTCVPGSTDITGNVTYLGIGKDNLDEWADAIGAALDRPRRSHVAEALAEGFDIGSVADGLTEKYLRLAGGSQSPAGR